MQVSCPSTLHHAVISKTRIDTDGRAAASFSARIPLFPARLASVQRIRGREGGGGETGHCVLDGFVFFLS